MILIVMRGYKSTEQLTGGPLGPSGPTCPGNPGNPSGPCRSTTNQNLSQNTDTTIWNYIKDT